MAEVMQYRIILTVNIIIVLAKLTSACDITHYANKKKKATNCEQHLLARMWTYCHMQKVL